MDYHFVGMVFCELVIEANSEAEAREQLDAYSADGWVASGTCLEVFDIDLLDVKPTEEG